MNADPVLIDDDDVDMEPVVIIDVDDDKINCDKTVTLPAVEIDTIVLDDEPVTGVETVNNTAKTFSNCEQAFINNLRNNTLMEKIVTACINMDNNVGMPRVIYKTLLPLYRDTSNTFKETERFRKLLKNTLKLLIRDPDHKFLHIKTLCEEFKSGGLRRKIPFVTLATDLKNNGFQWEQNTEINSSSREMNENRVENRQIPKVNTTRKNGRTVYKRKAKEPYGAKNFKKLTKSNTSSEKEKTDVIDLDNSENESVDRSNNDDSRNDVIFIDETEPSDSIKELGDNRKGPSDNRTEPNDNIKEPSDSRTEPSRNDNLKVSEEEITEEDSNKENKELENNSSNVPGDEIDLELLIPQVQIEILPEKPDLERIAQIEREIEVYKNMVAKLEEAEVTSNGPQSPYIQCSKLKEKIVQCYKKICEINGNNEGIIKRCEIRLHVADGHPPGPAKRLEQFLNDSIDSTGTVGFPDFTDVVKCVYSSNMFDSLGWSRQQILQEAAALFRQCGQALRKRRQKREYRDLLSLVRDKELIDDPAENDPLLQAKLDANMLMAKIKEEEILERYVDMENKASSRGVGNHSVGNRVEFESDKDSSGSDNESEQNLSLPNNTTTAAVNNQCALGECSKNRCSNIKLDLLISNNVIITSTANNHKCDIEESSKSNDIINNNVDVTMTGPPSTLKSNFMELVQAPSRSSNHVVSAATNDDQCAIRESSRSNNIISNNHSVITHQSSSIITPTNTRILTPDKTCDDCKTTDCLETQEVIKSGLNFTPTETIAAMINETPTETIAEINKEVGEMRSINNMKSITNSDVSANNEPTNVNYTQNYVSSTSSGVAQSNDPNFTKEDSKIEIEDRIKTEPMDIQCMLDELGDGFVCTVFDIEDPFLVIEISSDGFSDDEL